MVIIYFLRHGCERSAWREMYMERYRSGHNEAVLKTVCPQGRVGSNPTLSVGLDIEKKVLGQFGEVPKLAEGAPLERE